MTKNLRGKKKMRARRRLTRFELAQSLTVGLTTIDKLIGFGLRPIGRRGRAKLYDAKAARRLVQRLAPAQVAAGDVLIADYRSHTEDLDDRRQREVETWISDAAWRSIWQECVAVVARVTATWPQALEDRLGAVAPDETALLWADGPRPAPPPRRQYLTPEQVQTLLAGDVAAQPWRPAARAGIAVLVSRGLGVEIDDAGRWMHWNPAAGVPQPPAYPDPWMRPLLAEIADVVAASATFKGLEAMLRASAVEALPPMPETVDEARGQWRAARAAYRRTRITIRRGHRHRADVVRRIIEAIATFQARWWQARAQLAHVAGDAGAVFTLAERIRREALASLLSLNGAITDGATGTAMAGSSSGGTRKKTRPTHRGKRSIARRKS